MKKLGHIMNDLGFRAEASDATKAAFIRYLVKSTLNTKLQVPTELQENIAVGPTPKNHKIGEQLEFSFEESPTGATQGINKKLG